MAKRWAPYKDEIHSLYIGDGRSLDDVRRIIKGRHNFEASVRSYRTKLDEWGMKKNKVAASLGHKVGKSQVSGTTKKNGTEITAGASSTVHQQGTEIASPPGLPPMAALQFSNAWTGPLNFSDNLSQEMRGSGLPTIETFHDHSAPVRVDNVQILDITSQQGLFNAIRNGEEDHVATLLSAGISVQTLDGDGNSPLHAAILKGNLTIVKSLLKYGADVNAIGFKRRSPLHLAIRSEALAGILLRYSPLISPQDEDGNTPLHYLLNQENWWSPGDTAATIKAILSSGPDINIINRLGESPLHRMISDARPDDYKYMEIVFEMLHHNPDVKSPMRKHLNVMSVFLEKSELLATQKMLHRREAYSYWRGSGYRCLEKLLVAGADPNLIVGSKPLLIQYLLYGSYFEHTASEKALVLLIEKANLEIMGPGGNRPLHLILGGVEIARDYRQLGFHAITVALLDRNVDVNQRNDDGASPLELWLKRRRSKSCKSLTIVSLALRLVEAGADTTIQKSKGGTLFDMLDSLRVDDQNTLTKAFLKSAAIPIENRNNTAATSEWVEIWREAWKHEYWPGAKTRLGDLHQCPSRPRAAIFMDCATLIIVEHLLKSHKSHLKRWQESLVGKEEVEKNYDDYCLILRDCRERGIGIEVSWYAYLLDLMDFK